MSTISSIFSRSGDLSSKRVFGALGIVVILVCFTICAVNNQQLPSVTEYIFTGCVALLGCDSVTDIFKGK